MNLNIEQASKIYNLCQELNISIHKVSCPELKTLFLSVKKLERLAIDYKEDHYVQETIYNLKRYGFKCSVNLLPFNDEFLYEKQLKNLSHHLKILQSSYPELKDCLLEIQSAIESVSKVQINPLFQKVLGIVQKNPHQSVGIVLINSSLFDSTKILLNKNRLNNTELINSHQLIGPVFFERILVLGSFSLFPSHIFNSPRSRFVDLIEYDWLSGKFDMRILLAQASDTHPDNLKGKGPENGQDPGFISPEEITPRVNWAFLSLEAVQEAQKEKSVGKLDAKILLLEGDYFCFVEDSDYSSILVVDLEDDSDQEESSSKVKRLCVQDLKPGMFVVLRTEGGRDLLIPIADKLMGPRAEQARKLQEQWKKSFKKLVVESGVEEVSRRLTLLGSKRANPTNIRNWASPESIKPQDLADFMAIMKFIGEEEKAILFWEAASTIDQAHRSAGFVIRKMLLEKVAGVSSNELLRTGKMDFELKDKGGGKISVFRVIDISPESYLIEEYRTGHVFRKDE